MILAKYLKSILGSDADESSVKLCQTGPDGGEPVVSFDTDFDVGKQNILLYTSCHAIQLSHYLKSRKDVRNRFNVNWMLVHRLIQTNTDPFSTKLTRRMIGDAAVILMNPLIGHYERLRIEHAPELSHVRQLLFVPPNFAAFWPICEHFGETGVIKALNAGKTAEDVFKEFNSGTFDPCFAERWNAQIERLRARESEADIKLSKFVEDRHKDCKLWFTENHPTYNVIAWIASQFLQIIGLPYQSDTECAALEPDVCGNWNAHPETKYEFKHYGFKYPMRYEHEYGGPKFYKDVIDRIAEKYHKDKCKNYREGLVSYQ